MPRGPGALDDTAHRRKNVVAHPFIADWFFDYRVWKFLETLYMVKCCLLRGCGTGRSGRVAGPPMYTDTPS